MIIPSIRDLANSLIFRLSTLMLRVRLYLQVRLKLTKNYQPNPFDRKKSSALRVCADRYDAISSNLPDSPLSCLDIGCNQGYFTLSFAERGGYCLGIDEDRNAIFIAEAIRQINSVQNAVFSNSMVELENIPGLPKFDVVIFLSVFHHIVRHNGLSYAPQYMRELSRRNANYLVFETGQPNEQTMVWAKDMEFMLPDIEKWVEEMLLDIGYEKVKVIGRYQAVRSEVPRLLFLAEKEGQ